MRDFNYQKYSTKNWDNDILNLVAKIHEYKGRQELYVRQKPQELERLVEVAKIQSTQSSNQIEGIVTTSTRMKQLFAEKTAPRNRDEDEIMGYRDVLNTIHDSYEYIPVRPSYILQLHRDLLKRAGRSFSGQFKNGQNYINETRLDGTIVTRFVPLDPTDTPIAIDEICKAYQDALVKNQVDPLLLIPIFISDFLCIHPFNDGNGRMSRLLTLLLLYQNGYQVGKYISIEKQIEQTKDRYYDVLSQIDAGWHEGNNDPTPYIRYLLQVILACYVEFEERVGLMMVAGIKSSNYDIVRQYVERKIGKFTINDVLINCPNVSRSSALAVLSQLIEEHVVVRQGRGRGTFYLTQR